MNSLEFINNHHSLEDLTLDFSDNLITSLPTSLANLQHFPGLQNLEINMQKNKISWISKALEVFQHGFHKLKNLRLIFKNNELAYITPSIPK